MEALIPTLSLKDVAMPLLSPMLRMKTSVHPTGGYPSMVDVPYHCKWHLNTSLSTAAAELMATQEAFAQPTHLRAVLEDVETPQRRAITIYIDSHASYQVVIGEGFSERIYHISAAPLWVSELILSNIMTLKLILTTT